MRKGFLILAGVLLAAALPSVQKLQGTGRVEGTVKGEGGQPLADAVVRFSSPSAGATFDLKTDKKGHWAVTGIMGGTWNVDISAEGYETKGLSVQVSEVTRGRPVEVTLKKSAAGQQAAVGAKLNALLAEGNDLLRQKKFAEARAKFEGILQQKPELWQIEQSIAQAYYGEGQLDPAIEHLKKALEHDPTSPGILLLLGTIEMEKGDVDGGRAHLSKVDDALITDPTIYLNVGIGLLNKNKPADAIAYFDKALAKDAAYADAYYYRAIANLQLQKNDVAKPDLGKYLELAPTGENAELAKKILAQLGSK